MLRVETRAKSTPSGSFVKGEAAAAAARIALAASAVVLPGEEGEGLLLVDVDVAGFLLLLARTSSSSSSFFLLLLGASGFHSMFQLSSS